MEYDNAARTPVIVGIGELIDKVTDPAQGLEPLAMLERCARQAAEDAGAVGFLPRIDSIRVVSQLSWPYKDLAGLLAQRLGLRKAAAINGPIGGESPVRLLVDAAADIAEGHASVALVCGAEALKTAAQMHGAGRKPAWSDEDPNRPPTRAEDFVTPLAARYGLLTPLDVYPIYENACRAAWGQSFDDSQQESGTIWADMARVAAKNPYAWSGKELSAEEIVMPSEKNRPVSFPYQKFMVAQLLVNQAAAVIVTSLAQARAAGIPDEKLVYVWAGAGGHEPHDFLARDRYDHAPALDRVLQHTLAVNGLAAEDIDLFELYSCFPCVPKLARRSLGLPPDRPLSVTGGLSFFGGPGNNYMTHAITAMVRAIRNGEGRTGLLHGNGEYLTKHHAAVVAAFPPPSSVKVGNCNLQAELERDYAPVPELVEDYEGPCTIETYMVSYTSKGKPDRGTVIARTPDGRRLVARVTEADGDALAFLVATDEEAVGKSGHTYSGGDGWMHWGLVPRNEPAIPEVSFDIVRPHVALVTINRPAQRNAVNGAVARLIAQYVERIENDPEIRVAILTGAGDKAFCAGADLAEAAAGRGMELAPAPGGFAGFVNAKRRKPWIAAVRGFALGGGTELALACDLTIAGESACFGLPEVKRSLIAAAGGVYRLPRTVPRKLAVELMLTGEAIDARKALAVHLVNRVVADEQVIDEACRLAESIAENAPLAVYETLGIAQAAFDATDEALARKGLEGIARLAASEDFKEGSRAFLEKRKPVWKAR